LILPLLLTAIAATIQASAGSGSFPLTQLRVLVAYDGAATCGAYMLAAVAWED